MKTTLRLAVSVWILHVAFVPESYALSVKSRGPLLNDPAREAEFMDWGLCMFVHWSHDSQLGSVISHSMVGASEPYLDRYINELPKTFNPKKYDPDEWMDIAGIAGVKYMVLTTKHHNGFCMWDTQTTDFGILKSWRATDQTVISILGQNDKVLEYAPDADPESRFKQTEAGLEISVMRAQRIYNNRAWPNTVVVKLENVEFVEK